MIQEKNERLKKKKNKKNKYTKQNGPQMNNENDGMSFFHIKSFSASFLRKSAKDFRGEVSLPSW